MGVMCSCSVRSIWEKSQSKRDSEIRQVLSTATGKYLRCTHIPNMYTVSKLYISNKKKYIYILNINSLSLYIYICIVLFIVRPFEMLAVRDRLLILGLVRAIHWNWDERKGLKARLCYSSYPEIS